MTDVILVIARNAISYGYLIALTVREGLPASQFLLYFSAFTGFTALITAFLSECSTLHKECLELSVVQEYLHYPEPFRFSGGKPIPKADGYELRLENLSFTYPGTQKPILKHLNLTIHPGEKLAVVGLNGAGKTTLVSLLCGFYDPDEGRVLLNGTDIREFNRREYYGLFSAVFQNCSDLDITVAQWVAQAVDGIDLGKVKDCIQKAGLTQQIEAFPCGYDTHLGKKVYKDGVQLSGGQLQRLMLARALYKNGPILTLDEPTAALDPIAEHDIYQKYSEMTAGKTSVFISHRLASTRFCDRILFLQDGIIAEEGTHQQLLELGGEYAKLFQVQARYYQEGGAQDETLYHYLEGNRSGSSAGLEGNPAVLPRGFPRHFPVRSAQRPEPLCQHFPVGTASERTVRGAPPGNSGEVGNCDHCLDRTAVPAYRRCQSMAGSRLRSILPAQGQALQ